MNFNSLKIHMITILITACMFLNLFPLSAHGAYTNGANACGSDTTISKTTKSLLLAQNSTVKVKVTLKIPTPITVKFDAMGGKASKTSKIVFTGLKFGTLPTAKRSGYVFKGWYTAKKSGTAISGKSIVTIKKTKTYYAHWTKTQYFGPPMPSANILKVNINTAGLSDLQRITGIGPVLAQAIIDYRTLNGNFKDIEELMKVKGIGAKSFEKMKDQVTV